MTREQAQALLDRYLEDAPLLPAQGSEHRDQWFVGLVQRAYAAGQAESKGDLIDTHA